MKIIGYLFLIALVFVIVSTWFVFFNDSHLVWFEHFTEYWYLYIVQGILSLGVLWSGVLKDFK